MRNLYPKNKGKVYPSPSSSSSSSSSSSTISSSSTSPTRDVLSVLKLLPAAILALASVLSLEDREVLAYMITRSMKTTTTSPSSMIEEKKKCKKSSNTHKPPLFDCGCFDCYRSYWFRWDSSPNRELIHHVIEAFEEHLNNGEQSKKNNGRGKKKDRMGRRRVIEKLDDADRSESERFLVSEKEAETPETDDPLPEVDGVVVIVSGRAEEEIEEQVEEEEEEEEVVEDDKCTNRRNTEAAAAETEEEIQVPAASGDGGGDHHHQRQHQHKGMARMVIPDVLGLFNSRLWSLWNPSV